MTFIEKEIAKEIQVLEATLKVKRAKLYHLDRSIRTEEACDESILTYNVTLQDEAYDLLHDAEQELLKCKKETEKSVRIA